MKRSLLFYLFFIGIPFCSLFSQPMVKEDSINYLNLTDTSSTNCLVVDTIEEATFVCGNFPTSPKKYGNEIFKIVEEMPRFPGCEDMEGTSTEKRDCANLKLLQFIQKNLQWPPSFNTSCIDGRCYVTFVVEKDGSISNIELLRDLGGGAGAEAMKAVNEIFCQGIVWIPGKQRGQNVRVQFNMPIRFHLK